MRMGKMRNAKGKLRNGAAESNLDLNPFETVVNCLCVFCRVQMASSLSEQQRLKIEENRQRAMALRAARQQQQQPLTTADGSRKSSLVNNCQPVTNVTSARSSAVSLSSANLLPASSSSTVVRDVSGGVCARTTSKYSSVQSSSASSACKPWEPVTLADSSNRVPAAAVSGSKVSLSSSAPVPVKCCLVSRQKFAANTRYFGPLVEVFKSIPSKQYGE